MLGSRGVVEDYGGGPIGIGATATLSGPRNSYPPHVFRGQGCFDFAGIPLRYTPASLSMTCF